MSCTSTRWPSRPARCSTPTEVAAQMTRAREGMATQLASFTHNSSEFLRREQDLLLHGRGIPGTRTTFTGRPVVVVATGHEHREELKAVRRFVQGGRPGAGRGGRWRRRPAGRRAHAGRRRGHRGARPRGPGLGRALQAATDVVARLDRGSPATATASLRQLGVHPLRLETGATAEDAALILADARRGVGDRRGGHARDPRRVPRPAARRGRQHLPDPARGRADRSSTPPRCRCSTPAGCVPGTCSR